MPADGNRDGVVDAVDYVLWRKNAGAQAAGVGTNAVPEPSIVAFAVSTALIFSFRRH
jgi:hypothetical protein